MLSFSPQSKIQDQEQQEDKTSMVGWEAWIQIFEETFSNFIKIKKFLQNFFQFH